VGAEEAAVVQQRMPDMPDIFCCTSAAGLIGVGTVAGGSGNVGPAKAGATCFCSPSYASCCRFDTN
jgi:hypothetical protein